MWEEDAVLALDPTLTSLVAGAGGQVSGGLRRRSPICLIVRDRPRSRSGMSTGRRGGATAVGALPFRTCGISDIKNVVPKATSTSAAASAKTASGKRATVVE